MLHKRNRAFTLIELLVVISIIGVLASIVTIPLNNVRKNARDTTRLTDFAEFEKALLLYYDQYYVYPCADSNPNFDTSTSNGFLNGVGTISNSCVPPLSGISPRPPGDTIPGNDFYPLSWPKDPINSPGYYYMYYVDNNRQNYILFNHLEVKEDLAENDGGHCSNYYEVGPGKDVAGFLSDGNLGSSYWNWLEGGGGFGTPCN